MKKISRSDYFHFLICVETLKNEKATKEEKNKATSDILDTIKPYVAKR